MRIIGLTGEKGTGKNFVAECLVDVLKGSPSRIDVPVEVMVMAIADPFKRFLEDVLCLDGKALYGNDDDKETRTQYEWAQMPEFIRQTYPEKTGRMTVREVVQIGTDLWREVWGKDIWVNAMRRKIKSSSAEWIIVTDVRFPNEGDVIREMGGEIWRVLGPPRHSQLRLSGPNCHQSETIIERLCRMGGRSRPVRHDRVVSNGLSTTRDTMVNDLRLKIETLEYGRLPSIR